MTNEEYEREITAFLEKTKTRNDQKVKKVLEWRLDAINLDKKKAVVEEFKEQLLDFYRNLKQYYAYNYSLDIRIKEGEYNSDLEDLYFEGTWMKHE